MAQLIRLMRGIIWPDRPARPVLAGLGLGIVTFTVLALLGVPRLHPAAVRPAASPPPGSAADMTNQPGLDPRFRGRGTLPGGFTPAGSDPTGVPGGPAGPGPAGAPGGGPRGVAEAPGSVPVPGGAQSPDGDRRESGTVNGPGHGAGTGGAAVEVCRAAVTDPVGALPGGSGQAIRWQSGNGGGSLAQAVATYPGTQAAAVLDRLRVVLASCPRFTAPAGIGSAGTGNTGTGNAGAGRTEAGSAGAGTAGAGTTGTGNAGTGNAGAQGAGAGATEGAGSGGMAGAGGTGAGATGGSVPGGGAATVTLSPLAIPRIGDGAYAYALSVRGGTGYDGFLAIARVGGVVCVLRYLAAAGATPDRAGTTDLATSVLRTAADQLAKDQASTRAR